MVNSTMTSRSTIVGITRQSPRSKDIDSDAEHAPLPYEASGLGEGLIQNDDAAAPEYLAGDGYYNEDADASGNWKYYVIPSLLTTALIAWTGFFAWASRSENIQSITNERLITLIGNWSLPAIFIGLLWLIAMRSSRAEANRFADVSAKLRNESDALEIRMRTVNEEIALAREFLSQNALELESVGRHAAGKLTAAAEQLRTALSDSDEKAKTLEQVSNAATSNLEQLRKQLPVVTSAAKDITNQIGNAGNSAQLQVKTLIAALHKVADAGTQARESVDDLGTHADGTAQRLLAMTTSNAQMLEGHFNKADEFTGKIALQLEDAAKKIITTLADADEDVGVLVDVNVAKLNQQVEMLRESLSDLNTQSATEDARVSGMIARISSHIEDRSAVLASLDEASADRTVKLAFAVEALIASTSELNANLDHSGARTETLSDKSAQLFAALANIKTELETALPKALTSAESRISDSFSSIEAATQNVLSLGTISDDVLIKLTTIEKLIAAQKLASDELMNVSDAQYSSHSERSETLAASLLETRTMMEQLTDSANNELVEALGRVRDSTQEAAEASRHILDGEMENVAERLSEQSRNSLASAIDAQLSSLNEIVQKSFGDNILLSEEATKRISVQLAEIDTMTSNLEARAQAAREGFAGLDDDSFARRMVTMTESLNSTAIDVAKILSHEVSDTAWAAYLKGDRGVFTRRAVRLLDSGEAKAIATHYGEDPEFCEHVNRYIHDFESMMRVLLSTRDGNAIGVTLLSSDVGKLYVALAQAIERLRN
jgi:hypothetical protein